MVLRFALLALRLLINHMKNKTELPKSPFPYWLSFVLLHPWRKIVVQRERFVRKAGVTVGDTVFELGCGPGFFTEFIAKIITEKGIVYAQDVQPKILDQLKKRMEKFPLTENIRPLLASSAQIPLPDASIDVIFAANVLEEIERENILEDTAKEMERLLKKGAHITVIEHRIGVSKARFEKIVQALEDRGLKPVRRRLTLFMHFIWLEKPA